jgi:hypothetical protein
MWHRTAWYQKQLRLREQDLQAKQRLCCRYFPLTGICNIELFVLDTIMPNIGVCDSCWVAADYIQNLYYHLPMLLEFFRLDYIHKDIRNEIFSWLTKLIYNEYKLCLDTKIFVPNKV